MKKVVVNTSQQKEPRNFPQWCSLKNSLPAATKQTIDLLLKQSGTKDCQLAESKLSTLTYLFLDRQNISDLSPLASLSNLTQLYLGANQIVDLQPLAGLDRLITLDLSGNQIVDLKPLAGLDNLITLDLSGNQIDDLQPLAGLISLTTLYLSSNQILDLKPLVDLINLTELYIDGKKMGYFPTTLDRHEAPFVKTDICDEIEANGECVRCGIVEDMSLTLVELALRFGLIFTPSLYEEISQSQAKILVKKILREIYIPETEALALASRFLNCFDAENTRYYTNCDYQGKDGIAWDSATECMFDIGILALGKLQSGCLWIAFDD
jgi:Leucine Rich repeats (2 copies)